MNIDFILDTDIALVYRLQQLSRWNEYEKITRERMGAAAETPLELDELSAFLSQKGKGYSFLWSLYTDPSKAREFAASIPGSGALRNEMEKETADDRWNNIRTQLSKYSPILLQGTGILSSLFASPAPQHLDVLIIPSTKTRWLAAGTHPDHPGVFFLELGIEIKTKAQLDNIVATIFHEISHLCLNTSSIEILRSNINELSKKKTGMFSDGYVFKELIAHAISTKQGGVFMHRYFPGLFFPADERRAASWKPFDEFHSRIARESAKLEPEIERYIADGRALDEPLIERIAAVANGF